MTLAWNLLFFITFVLFLNHIFLTLRPMQWTSMIATEDVRKIEETVDDEFHTTLDQVVSLLIALFIADDFLQLSADDVQNMMMNGTRNPDRRYRDSAG